jgi:hypothetical protein
MRIALLGLLALPVAACGSDGGSTDIKGTLVFADRTDTEIARLINAAGGTDMFSAQGTVDGFSGPTADPCPGVAVEGGDTIIVTGGCTTMDGAMLTGSARITNPLGWDQVEPQFGKDTDYEFEQLSITQQGFTQTFDGFMKITDSFSTHDADVTVTSFDMTVRSDLYYHCSQDGQSSVTCELSGSGIELVGTGGAVASGTLHQGSSVSASFTLRGADTLKVTIENGCVAWRIEGTERAKTCP